MTIGQVLTDLRKKKSIRQGVAAKGIGVSQTWLSLVEKDKRVPSTKMIEKFAKFYGMETPVLYWLTVTEDSVSPNKKDMFRKLKPVVDSLVKEFIG
jgi:transcriptional regulator with XRE-family HTH domain